MPIKVLELENQRQLIALRRCGVQEQKTLQKLIENRQQQLEVIALQELIEIRTEDYDRYHGN